MAHRHGTLIHPRHRQQILALLTGPAAPPPDLVDTIPIPGGRRCPPPPWWRSPLTITVLAVTCASSLTVNVWQAWLLATPDPAATALVTDTTPNKQTSPLPDYTIATITSHGHAVMGACALQRIPPGNQHAPGATTTTSGPATRTRHDQPGPRTPLP